MEPLLIARIHASGMPHVADEGLGHAVLGLVEGSRVWLDSGSMPGFVVVDAATLRAEIEGHRRSLALLVEACLEGREDGWRDLFERIRPMTFALASEKGLTAAEADGLYQEVCLSVHGSLSTLEEPARLDRWARTIIRRRVADRLRRRDDATVALPSEPRDPDEAPPRQERFLLHEEQLVLLDAALAELEERQRLLVESYYLQGLSYEEIERDHGIPHGSIGPTLGRAMDRLEEALDRLLRG